MLLIIEQHCCKISLVTSTKKDLQGLCLEGLYAINCDFQDKFRKIFSENSHKILTNKEKE